MATRYLYNNEKYNSLYSLRQAIGRTERLAYGNASTQAEFNKLPLKNKVVFEEYDPLDEIEIEALRAQKLVQMKQEFSRYTSSSTTSIETSLGFSVNASETAFEDVECCIAQLEQGLVASLAENQEATISFRDYNNQSHDLTLAQLKTIKGEIAANRSRAYAKKWEYTDSIKSAERADLKSMNQFSFTE